MTRSRFRSFHTAVVTSGLTAAFTSVAFAQEPAPAAPPVVLETQISPAQPLPGDPIPPPAPVAPPPTTYVQTPAPAPEGNVNVAPSVAQKEPLPTEETPSEETEQAPWYDGISVGMFVDAYGAIRSDTNGGRPAVEDSGQASPAGYPHEAYVQADGFQLAFAGADLAYSGDKFGATISLRFGPGVNRFYAGNKSDLGIDNITQAFATWKPTEKLTLDLGQFGTLYGAEVLESWKNVNYSRGALYYAMQPFWHTGLRANYKFTDEFALNAMLVNGVNNAFEDNKSPTVGVQAVITPGDMLALSLGYMGALNPRDGGNGPFHNFFDFTGTLTAGGFKLVANADLNLYKLPGTDDTENWWGISLAPAYAFNEYFGAAIRAEYLSDSANFLFGMSKDKAREIAAGDSSLVTLTATLDIKPVPGSSAVVLRPEFRYENASDYYFGDKDNKATKGFWVATLGAVVTSM